MVFFLYDLILEASLIKLELGFPALGNKVEMVNTGPGSPQWLRYSLTLTWMYLFLGIIQSDLQVARKMLLTSVGLVSHPACSACWLLFCVCMLCVLGLR